MGEMSFLNKLKDRARKYRYNRYRKIDERNQIKIQIGLRESRPIEMENIQGNPNKIIGINGQDQDGRMRAMRDGWKLVYCMKL